MILFEQDYMQNPKFFLSNLSIILLKGRAARGETPVPSGAPSGGFF